MALLPCPAESIIDAAQLARHALYDGAPRVIICAVAEQPDANPKYSNVVTYRRDQGGVIVISH
jgi:hypothetical protein